MDPIPTITPERKSKGKYEHSAPFVVFIDRDNMTLEFRDQVSFEIAVRHLQKIRLKFFSQQ
ncbi:MAG: hypothetical protein A2W19_02555 [Spirochaetes bacterium RBG_16_49_21]|nr:MAG: hypothetical protein A2W19_02555 [Spirochaetes bacterium RBG_16_49_21]